MPTAAILVCIVIGIAEETRSLLAATRPLAKRT